MVYLHVGYFEIPSAIGKLLSWKEQRIGVCDGRTWEKS